MSWPSYLHSPERTVDELDWVLQRALERADLLGYRKPDDSRQEHTADA
jgi:hypothetical protein